MLLDKYLERLIDRLLAKYFPNRKKRVPTKSDFFQIIITTAICLATVFHVSKNLAWMDKSASPCIDGQEEICNCMKWEAVTSFSLYTKQIYGLEAANHIIEACNKPE